MDSRSFCIRFCFFICNGYIVGGIADTVACLYASNAPHVRLLERIIPETKFRYRFWGYVLRFMFSVCIFKGAVQETSFDGGFWTLMRLTPSGEFCISTLNTLLPRTRIRDLWGDAISVSSAVAAFLGAGNDCRFKIVRQQHGVGSGAVTYNLFLGPIAYITQSCSACCNVNPNGDTTIVPTTMFSLDVAVSPACRHDQWSICTTIDTISKGAYFATDSVHPGSKAIKCGICDIVL